MADNEDTTNEGRDTMNTTSYADRELARMTTLTVADIEAGYRDDRWLGWGYLGGRASAANEANTFNTDKIADADRFVLEVANRKQWTRENLFAWLNSKSGRWFADIAFGGGNIQTEATDTYFPTMLND